MKFLRNILISTALRLWSLDERLTPLAFDLYEDDDGSLCLIEYNVFLSWICDHVSNLASYFWNLGYPGSDAEREFLEEFPPHLHPNYHNLPDFGTYPLALRHDPTD